MQTWIVSFSQNKLLTILSHHLIKETLRHQVGLQFFVEQSNDWAALYVSAQERQDKIKSRIQLQYIIYYTKHKINNNHWCAFWSKAIFSSNKKNHLVVNLCQSKLFNGSEQQRNIKT